MKPKRNQKNIGPGRHTKTCCLCIHRQQVFAARPAPTFFRFRTEMKPKFFHFRIEMKTKFFQFGPGTRLEKSDPEPVHPAPILAAIFHTTSLKYPILFFVEFFDSAPAAQHPISMPGPDRAREILPKFWAAGTETQSTSANHSTQNPGALGL